MYLCEIELPPDCVLVFDLDDTLFAERDFVRSGFRMVGLLLEQAGATTAFERLEYMFDQGVVDPIGVILQQDGLQLEKSKLIEVYREHMPDLHLRKSVVTSLKDFYDRQYVLGILTDGRSQTQRNKIAALGLEEWINEIVISEEFGSAKPAVENYLYFENRFPGRSYVYVGDNLQKDFVTPNRLRWKTIGVRDQGQNIHPQQIDNVSKEYQPHFWVKAIAPAG